MEKLQASSESVVFVGIQLPVGRESRVVTNFERRKEFVPISVFPPEEKKQKRKRVSIRRIPAFLAENPVTSTYQESLIGTIGAKDQE
jgi:hypothetical protein